MKAHTFPTEELNKMGSTKYYIVEDKYNMRRRIEVDRKSTYSFNNYVAKDEWGERSSSAIVNVYDGSDNLIASFTGVSAFYNEGVNIEKEVLECEHEHRSGDDYHTEDHSEWKTWREQ